VLCSDTLCVLFVVVVLLCSFFYFFFQAEDGIRDFHVTGVQTCALPIWVFPWKLSMRNACSRLIRRRSPLLLWQKRINCWWSMKICREELAHSSFRKSLKTRRVIFCSMVNPEPCLPKHIGLLTARTATISPNRPSTTLSSWHTK